MIKALKTFKILIPFGVFGTKKAINAIKTINTVNTKKLAFKLANKLKEISSDDSKEILGIGFSSTTSDIPAATLQGAQPCNLF